MKTQKSVKRGLTAAIIEDAALAAIEADGLEVFSLRRLSARLGCEPMSLYHHFPSKAHLMDALVDRLMGELEIPSATLPWRERLVRLAHDFRQMACRHPAFFQYLALHRLNTPGALRWLDGALNAFRDIGVDAETATRLFRGFGYYITGAALDETAGYAKGPSARVPLSEQEIGQTFPAVAGAAAYFRPDQFDATFQLGLGLMLDGLALQLGQAAGKPGKGFPSRG
jgi:AcrR family transcriptional regulator